MCYSKALKAKDTRWLQLIGDACCNVTHVRDLRTSYSGAAETVVAYAHAKTPKRATS